MLEEAVNQRLAIALAVAPRSAATLVQDTENVASDNEAPINTVDDPYLERSSNEFSDDHVEEEDDADEGDDDIDDDEDDDAEDVDNARMESASLDVLGTLSSTTLRRKRVRKRRRVRNKRSPVIPSTEMEDLTPGRIAQELSAMTSASISCTSTITTPSMVGASRGGSSPYLSNSINSNTKQQSGGLASSNQKSKKPHDAPMTKSDLYYSIRCGMIQAEIDVIITSPTTTNTSPTPTAVITTKRIVRDVIGRITLVNWDNKVVYDVFVIPQFSLSQQQQFKVQEQAVLNMATTTSLQQEKMEFCIHRILDYRTAITGITHHHYEQSKKDSCKEEFNLSTIEAAKPIVKKYIKGKILIGYNIPNDLGMMHDGITHPKRDVRDIAQFAPYMNTVVTARPMSFSVSQDKQQIVHLESIPLQRLMEQYTKDEPILKNNFSKKDHGILYQEAVGCMCLYKRLRSEWEDELCRLSRHKYKLPPILPLTTERSDVAALDPLPPPLVTPVVLSQQQPYASSMEQMIPIQHHQQQHRQLPYTTSVSNQHVQHRGVVNLSKQSSTAGSLSSTGQQRTPYYHHSHGMTILPSSTSLSYPPKASFNEGQWHHPVYAHPQHQTWNSVRPEEQYQLRDDRVLEAQDPPLSIPSSRYYNQGQNIYHASVDPPAHRISTTPKISHLSPRRSCDVFDVDHAERTSTLKLNDYHHHHHHSGMNYSHHSLSEGLRQRDANNGHRQRQPNSFTSNSVPMDPWTSQLPSSHPQSANLMVNSENPLMQLNGGNNPLFNQLSDKSQIGATTGSTFHSGNIGHHENDLALFNDRKNNLPINEIANENPEYSLPMESYLPSDINSWSPLLHNTFSLLSLLDNDSSKTPSAFDNHPSSITSGEATTAGNKVDTMFQWDTLLTSIQQDTDVNSSNHFH